MSSISLSSFDQFKETAINNAGGGTKSYDQFVEDMHNAGIKTTHINKNEANFADYGNALSDDLKQQIMDSFDCQQDYELQSLIAGVYADSGRSVLQSGQFINACKSLGLSVNVEYQKTSYIPDYKAGNFGNNVKEGGAIAVYTISDGMGGEIVIADANGNAALESEELFMNQILGDINYEISANKNVGATYTSNNNSGTAEGVSGASESNSLFSKDSKDKEVEQKDYNKLVEKYLENGSTMEEAIKKADQELKVNNMTYSGSMEEKVEQNVEQTAKETVEEKTENRKIVDEVVSKTVDKKEETDEKETIVDFASEVAENIFDELNFFAA